MMSYCSYSMCTKKKIPCSSTTFFNLPKDQRREIWIENSGNPALKNITPTASRLFCEHHFHPKFIRRQFTRTLLHRDAIPYKYCEFDESSDEFCKETEEIANEDGDILQFVESTSIGTHADYVEPYKIVYKEYDQSCLDDEVLEDESLTGSLSGQDENSSDEKIAVDYVSDHSAIIEDENGEKSHSASAEENIEEEPTKENWVKDYDEDKHFTLSLLGFFKRLPPKTKATAKLKILQYLTELEWENASDALKN